MANRGLTTVPPVVAQSYARDCNSVFQAPERQLELQMGPQGP